MGLPIHTFLLLGDSGTGKTQSLRTLLGDNYEQSEIIKSKFSLVNWLATASATTSVATDVVAEAVATADAVATSVAAASASSVATAEAIATQDNYRVVCWDSSGDIKDINYFFLPNHIKTVLLYLNMESVIRTDRLDYWFNFAQKYFKLAQVVVVGCCKESVLPKSITVFEDDGYNVLDNKKLEVLQWCVEKGDLPFFSIQLNKQSDIAEMFKSIITSFS